MPTVIEAFLLLHVGSILLFLVMGLIVFIYQFQCWLTIVLDEINVSSAPSELGVHHLTKLLQFFFLFFLYFSEEEDGNFPSIFLAIYS